MKNKPDSICFVARMAAVTSLMALSIDAMLPALTDIGESLEVHTLNDLQLVITLFILGMFFGELWIGPISDSLGRKKTLAIGVAIYCSGTILSMFAPNMEILLAGRIVQGIGAAAPKIIPRAMIRDQYSGNHMARVSSLILTVFICIPMVAPALGQLISELMGWRVIFLVFFLIAFGSTTWVMLRQPETLSQEKRIKFSVGSLIRTSVRIARHRTVCCYTITSGLIFSIYLLYLSTSQAMFMQIYGKGESFPFYFAFLATGLGFAALMNSKLVIIFGMHRLCLTALFGLILLSAFFFFAGEGGVPSFTAFMTGCYALMVCAGLLFSNLSALAMQPLGAVAGFGASLISAVSSIIAVAISITAGRFFDNTLNVLSCVIFICTLLSLILFFMAEREHLSPVKGCDTSSLIR